MTRVKIRSSLEHVSGDTVKVLKATDLPKGCCVLRDGLPCTYRMTHVRMKVESFIWLDDGGKPNLVIEGFCKSHRPKVGEVIELPKELAKLANGGSVNKARLKKMEAAFSVNIIAEGGSVVHKMERSKFHPAVEAGNWSRRTRTLCDKVLKVGVVPTPNEARLMSDCSKCNAAAASLTLSMSGKDK